MKYNVSVSARPYLARSPSPISLVSSHNPDENDNQRFSTTRKKKYQDPAPRYSLAFWIGSILAKNIQTTSVAQHTRVIFRRHTLTRREVVITSCVPKPLHRVYIDERPFSDEEYFVVYETIEALQPGAGPIEIFNPTPGVNEQEFERGRKMIMRLQREQREEEGESEARMAQMGWLEWLTTKYWARMRIWNERFVHYDV